MEKHKFVYFCPQYTSRSTAEIKAAVQELEANFRDIEEGLRYC